MTTDIPTPELLTVYGASWCGDCRNTRRYLDGANVTYRYVDLQVDASAQALLADAGIRSIPVVVLTDGTILIEPSERELASALDAVAA